MACVDECPVHAIYAGEEVPPEFQADIEINATEARRVQESGQGASKRKRMPCPLPPKEGGIGLLSSLPTPTSEFRVPT